MKKLCFLLLSTSFLFSQTTPAERKNSIAIFGGMGVHLVSAPDVVDYINTIAAFSHRVDDFGTAVDFFGGVEFPIDDEWGMKVEHSYLFKSYSVLGNLGGTYDFFYSVHSPSLLIQKIISGRGYFLKLGAGGGYHVGYASQKVSTFGTTTEYSADGIGVKAEIVGQTAFDDHLYGYIGGSLGWEFIGELKDKKDVKLTASNSTKPVSVRYVHAGIRFGINYYF